MKELTIKAIETFAKEHGLSRILVVWLDPDTGHECITCWGATEEDDKAIFKLGYLLKDGVGWDDRPSPLPFNSNWKEEWKSLNDL